MWTIIASGTGVLSLLILGFYVGKKISTLSDSVEARNEYIKRQTAVLGAFVAAAKRGDNLAEFIEKLGNASTPAELSELYGSLLPKTPNSNP